MEDNFDDDCDEDWMDTSWAEPLHHPAASQSHAQIPTYGAVACPLGGGKLSKQPTSTSNCTATDKVSPVQDMNSDSGAAQMHKGEEGMVRRMLLNDNKAGMEGLDKERTNQIIHDASKGSRFYENERLKEQQMGRRIEEQTHKIRQISDAQLQAGQLEADNLLADFDQQRDLGHTIVHVDMDMFYAAVEMRDQPQLKTKPMAVGSNSMLSTSNYLARKFGVRAAMPGFIGKKLCPDLIIVPLNFDKYISVSKLVKSVFSEYDANFCPMSLDEAYLDITEHLQKRRLTSDDDRTFYCRDSSYADSRAHCLCDLNERLRHHGSEFVSLATINNSNLNSGTKPNSSEDSNNTDKSHNDSSIDRIAPNSNISWQLACSNNDSESVDSPAICAKCKKPFPPFMKRTFGLTVEEAVLEMRTRIEQKTRLTASAGIAPNMMLAKVCSDRNKPNGQYRIPATREAVMDFIRDLPTRKISGIGKVSEAMLNATGVFTCTDLFTHRGLLFHLYSQISFNYFMRICLGIGSTTVERDTERKSMSTERTFSELHKPADLYEKCEELCQCLAEDLKSEQLKGRTVSIKVKTVKFEVRTRAHSLREYTSDAADILRSAQSLLKTEIDNCHPQPLRLRLMGVRMSSLLHESLCKTQHKQNTIMGAFKRQATRAKTGQQAMAPTSTGYNVNNNMTGLQNTAIIPLDTPLTNDMLESQSTVMASSGFQINNDKTRTETSLLQRDCRSKNDTYNGDELKRNSHFGRKPSHESRVECCIDRSDDAASSCVEGNENRGAPNDKGCNRLGISHEHIDHETKVENIGTKHSYEGENNNIKCLPVNTNFENNPALNTVISNNFNDSVDCNNTECSNENVQQSDVIDDGSSSTQLNTANEARSDLDNFDSREIDAGISESPCLHNGADSQTETADNGEQSHSDVIIMVDNDATPSRRTRSGATFTPGRGSNKKRKRGGGSKGLETDGAGAQRLKTYTCPVCARTVKCKGLAEFNKHVDQCLESGGMSAGADDTCGGLASMSCDVKRRSGTNDGNIDNTCISTEKAGEQDIFTRFKAGQAENNANDPDKCVCIGLGHDSAGIAESNVTIARTMIDSNSSIQGPEGFGCQDSGTKEKERTESFVKHKIHVTAMSDLALQDKPPDECLRTDRERKFDKEGIGKSGDASAKIISEGIIDPLNSSNISIAEITEAKIGNRERNSVDVSCGTEIDTKVNNSCQKVERNVSEGCIANTDDETVKAKDHNDYDGTFVKEDILTLPYTDCEKWTEGQNNGPKPSSVEVNNNRKSEMDSNDLKRECSDTFRDMKVNGKTILNDENCFLNGTKVVDENDVNTENTNTSDQGARASLKMNSDFEEEMSGFRITQVSLNIQDTQRLSGEVTDSDSNDSTVFPSGNKNSAIKGYSDNKENSSSCHTLEGSLIIHRNENGCYSDTSQQTENASDVTDISEVDTESNRNTNSASVRSIVNTTLVESAISSNTREDKEGISTPDATTLIKNESNTTETERGIDVLCEIIKETESSDIVEDLHNAGIINDLQSESVRKVENIDNRNTLDKKKSVHDTVSLLVQSTQSVSNQDTSSGSNQDTSSVSLLVCPVCNIEQRLSSLEEFNQHVDSCLSRGAISEILKQQREQEKNSLKRSRHPSTPSSSQQSKKRRTVIPGQSPPCRSITSFFQK